jgi:hypothetical protein
MRSLPGRILEPESWIHLLRDLRGWHLLCRARHASVCALPRWYLFFPSVELLPRLRWQYRVHLGRIDCVHRMSLRSERECAAHLVRIGERYVAPLDPFARVYGVWRPFAKVSTLRTSPLVGFKLELE